MTLRLKDTIEGTISNANSVPWSGVTGKPSSYTPSTHSHTFSQISDRSTYIYDATISRTKNTVLAAPNGSNGAGTFRALVAADIPALAISKITSLQSTLDGKASTSHNHDSAYAAKSHNHDGTYLKLSGGTLTGAVSFNAKNNTFSCSGGNWINGKTQANAPIAFTSAVTKDGSRYDPYMWGKNTDGDVWNFGGGATNTVGFWGFNSGRTANGTDWGVTVNITSGLLSSSGGFSGNLSGNASTATKADKVKDSNDGGDTTFAYSKAGMNYGDYTWLAAWNGKELRAVSKTQFATAHSHPYLPTAGGTMSGNITFAAIGDKAKASGISWSGSTDGASIYYETRAVDEGHLVLNMIDDSNVTVDIAAGGAVKSYFSYDGVFHGTATYANSADSAGNADTVDGLHASHTVGKTTLVTRDGNGYTNLNYINSNTGNNENPTISQVIVTNGSDNYYRKASLAHLKSSLGSMPASDVSSWAKQPSKPSYSVSVNVDGNGNATFSVS